MLYKFILSIFISVFISSCVSIGVEEPKFTKDSQVMYEPPNGFLPVEQEHVDKAWKNINNGNSISFLSECTSQSDLPHTRIREGIISGLHNRLILKEEMIDFNKRKALISTLTGTVDGIDIKSEIVILKKNNCTYILTYIGIDEKFDINHLNFQTFLQGFKVP